MDRSLQLYPAQQEGVDRFLASTRRRLVLAYGTGCGKTATAIHALIQHAAEKLHDKFTPRFLVVCPAIVRRHWQREFARWAGLHAAPIEMGRTRRTGAKHALETRDLAYATPIQVVSYDLISQVDAEGWDAIVFDEIHHLSDCQSKQSRSARALMKANPGVAALGLSATLIPTQIWQLWHPLHLLFGNQWGRPPRAGKFSWDFIGRYCEINKNDYGSLPGKPRESRQSELRNRVSQVAHRLTREDLAQDLPAIDLSVVEGSGPKTGAASYAVDWVEALEPDITHSIVLCYHRDLATSIASSLRSKGLEPIAIDGSVPTQERVALLDAAEQNSSAVIVATSESIREGIRLMWAQKVLLVEWRQSPKQVLQVLGRFQSIGDPRRPQIQVLVDESLHGEAMVLFERVKAINGLIKGGKAEEVISEVFAPRELSDARMAELTRTMLADFKPVDAEWVEETEEADEW